MEWLTLGWQWLAHACLSSFALLGAASLAIPWIRQPARRLRLIECTLAACLVAPWLQFVPGIPRESLLRAPWFRADVRSRFDAYSAPLPVRRLHDGAAIAERPLLSVRQGFAPLLSFNGFRWTAAVVLLYFCGASVVILRWLAGAIKLKRLRNAAAPAPANARRLLLKIAGADARDTLLAVSREIDTPIAFGWHRPAIIVPESLCRPGCEEALRYALAHEWNHVERCDVLAWHLSSLAYVVYFYQPLIWRLRRHMRLCQDFLADARAAAQGATAEDYADHLVAMALGRLKSPPWPALTFGDRRSNLFHRVMTLLERRQPLEQRCRAGWSLTSSAAVLLLTFSLGSLRLNADEMHPLSSVASKARSASYQSQVCDDETGRPIQGATVVVRRREASVSGDRVLQESLHCTDAAGRFSFAVFPEHLSNASMYLEFDVEHPGYASKAGISCSLDKSLRMNLSGGAAALELIPLRRGEEAVGVVETADGRPAEGVDVVAYSLADLNVGVPGSLSRTKTDAEGRFRVMLAVGSDGVLCLQSSAGIPLVYVTRRQRGDLGRFRLIDSASSRSVSQQFIYGNSSGTAATARMSL